MQSSKNRILPLLPKILYMSETKYANALKAISNIDYRLFMANKCLVVLWISLS